MQIIILYRYNNTCLRFRCYFRANIICYYIKVHSRIDCGVRGIYRCWTSTWKRRVWWVNNFFSHVSRDCPPQTTTQYTRVMWTVYIIYCILLLLYTISVVGHADATPFSCCVICTVSCITRVCVQRGGTIINHWDSARGGSKVAVVGATRV